MIVFGRSRVGVVGLVGSVGVEGVAGSVGVVGIVGVVGLPEPGGVIEKSHPDIARINSVIKINVPDKKFFSIKILLWFSHIDKCHDFYLVANSVVI